MRKGTLIISIDPLDAQSLQIKAGKGNVSRILRQLIQAYLSNEQGDYHQADPNIIKSTIEKSQIQEQIKQLEAKYLAIESNIEAAQKAREAEIERERQATIMTQIQFGKQYLSDALTGRLGSAEEERREAERNGKNNTEPKQA